MTTIPESANMPVGAENTLTAVPGLYTGFFDSSLRRECGGIKDPDKGEYPRDSVRSFSVPDHTSEKCEHEKTLTGDSAMDALEFFLHPLEKAAPVEGVLYRDTLAEQITEFDTENTFKHACLLAARRGELTTDRAVSIATFLMQELTDDALEEAKGHPAWCNPDECMGVLHQRSYGELFTAVWTEGERVSIAPEFEALHREDILEAIKALTWILEDLEGVEA